AKAAREVADDALIVQVRLLAVQLVQRPRAGVESAQLVPRFAVALVEQGQRTAVPGDQAVVEQPDQRLEECVADALAWSERIDQVVRAEPAAHPNAGRRRRLEDAERPASGVEIE